MDMDVYLVLCLVICVCAWSNISSCQLCVWFVGAWCHCRALPGVSPAMVCVCGNMQACVCVWVCVQVYTLMHPCSSHCSITFLCHASVRRHWTLDLWLTGVRRAPPHIYLNSVWQCRVHCLAFLDVSSNHTEFVLPSQSKHDVSVACTVELTWQAAAAVCNMRRSACRVPFAPDAR